VRTPFQRDRDRIVHSKPFRRLKGKTQVFIDPEGDHYRTRMTHTLETTAISRVVARALRLNEDLTEAIGLGHDMGHTPFGHAGEDALDTALGRHFGPDAGFRHHEHSYRIARGLNLTYDVYDGILTHTGEREPDTLEGRSCASSTASPTSTTTSTTPSATASHEATCRSEEIELLGPTGRSRSTGSSSTWSRPRRPPGDIRQSEEIGGAMHRLPDFMFERVYLAEHATDGAPRAHETDRPHRRPPRRAGRPGRRDHRIRRRDDRPVRPDRTRTSCMARDQGRLRRGRQGSERHRRPRRGVHRLRKSGSRYTGLCPFHQERTPSFGVSPDRGTFKCFGCGEGGDAIAFVEKKENLDFVGAIEWLGDRFGVQLEYEETSPEQDRARKRRERLFQLLDRAAVFYEKYLWESESGAFARDYLASRGLGEEVCREFRLGFAPGGAALARAALDQGFTGDELSRRRPRQPPRKRLLHPAAAVPARRLRGRVRGFQARQLDPENDPLRAKYVNSPEGDLFRKGDLLYGLDLARQRSRRKTGS
jgi:hypothetical protein